MKHSGFHSIFKDNAVEEIENKLQDFHQSDISQLTFIEILPSQII